MCFIFVMEASHFIIHVVLLIASFRDNSEIADDWFVDGLSGLVYAVLFFFAVFNIVSILLIGQLLQFHIGLQRDGITTYQYIVRDHKMKRERLRLEDELRGQRAQKIAAAREQGKSFQVMRLRIGNECRAAGCAMCDPLALPEPNPEPDPEAGFAAALGTGANLVDKSDDGHDADETDADDGQVDSTGAAIVNDEHTNTMHIQSERETEDHGSNEANGEEMQADLDTEEISPIADEKDNP